jgi:ADP-heptose:LPS heptosyltransferase
MRDKPEIDWEGVRRVLVVRLRSIGDTVLATPSLTALKRFLPGAKVDILLEDWVAPLLEGFEDVDDVIPIGRRTSGRLAAARDLRRRRYDVVFNLHGGSTSTFLTRATGARFRVGNADYRYSSLYSHLVSSSAEFWGRTPTHSAEQQLALLGAVGIPVDDRPKSRLPVTDEALGSVFCRLTAEMPGLATRREGGDINEALELPDFALIHPAAAFATKQWSPENYARAAEFLAEKGLISVAVSAPDEKEVLRKMSSASSVPIVAFHDLSLPEITALASRASIFVGNDSGIAHIAAAVGTPTVVIFGSSNRDHWRPWTDASNEIVYEEFHCQPCPGYECKEFGQPQCIQTLPVSKVISAIENLIS